VAASGTAQIEVIATDAHYMTAIDLFDLTFAPASSHITSAIPAASMGLAEPFHPSQTAGLIAFHG